MSKKIKVRPGKTQSKAGFIVGIMFCLIGIFVAIPMAGLFGVLWTGVFDDFRTSHDVHMETDSEDIEGRLRQLQSLYQQELITREEYESKRQEILERL